MKAKLVLMSILVLLFAEPSHAETLGDLTYSLPHGWQPAQRDAAHAAYTKSSQDRTATANLTLYPDRHVTADADADFEAEWRKVTASQRLTEIAERQTAGNFTVREALASTSEGVPIYLALAVYRSDNCAADIVMIAAPGDKDHAFSKDLTSVLGSIRRTRPCQNSAAPDVANISRGSGEAFPIEGDGPARPVSLIGAWERSVGVLRTFGVNGNFNQAWGAGSYESSYNFHPNGVFEFQSVTWGGNYQTSYILRFESGSYAVNGSTIRIGSTICRQEVHEGAKNGPLKRIEECRPSTHDYRATWLYLSGQQEWRLVLASDHETERDGGFSGIGHHPKSYPFKAVRRP